MKIGQNRGDPSAWSVVLAASGGSPSSGHCERFDRGCHPGNPGKSSDSLGSNRRPTRNGHRNRFFRQQSKIYEAYIKQQWARTRGAFPKWPSIKPNRSTGLESNNGLAWGVGPHTLTNGALPQLARGPSRQVVLAGQFAPDDPLCQAPPPVELTPWYDSQGPTNRPFPIPPKDAVTKTPRILK